MSQTILIKLVTIVHTNLKSLLSVEMCQANVNQSCNCQVGKFFILLISKARTSSAPSTLFTVLERLEGPNSSLNKDSLLLHTSWTPGGLLWSVGTPPPGLGITEMDSYIYKRERKVSLCVVFVCLFVCLLACLLACLLSCLFLYS